MGEVMELEKFKDRHKGKRAFLLACGPSTNTQDLSFLDGELIFGVSLGYKMEVDIDYHFMGDKKIASQFYEEILPLTNPWFVSYGIYMEYLRGKENIYYFKGPNERKFSTDLSDGRIYGGGTSSFLAMQFAYYMGITEFIAIGLDHWKSYEKGLDVKSVGIQNPSGQPLVKSMGDDEHHFTKDFYGEGVEYYTPTIPKIEEAYRMAREAYERDGRKLLNASADTALSEEIIPRVDFYTVFGGRDELNSYE